MAEEGSGLFRIQQGFPACQGDVREQAALRADAVELCAPVVFPRAVQLIVFLIGVEAEKTAAVTAKGDMACHRAQTHAAHVAGRGKMSVDKTRVLTARLDLRHRPELPQQLLRLGAMRVPRLEGQTEALHLPEEALVDFKIHPRVVAKDRLAYG